MKKTIVLAALLAAMSAGTTSFAATEYDSTQKSVSNTEQSSYKTVLISKGNKDDAVTDENIVYVNQADNTFDAATSFLLKSGVTDGVYTLRFGGSTGECVPKEFAIGVGIEGYDTKLNEKGKVINSNGKYSYGFVTSDSGVSLTNNAIILVKIDGDVLAYPMSNNVTLTGGANVKLGVQIDDIENENTDVQVFIRQGATAE